MSNYKLIVNQVVLEQFIDWLPELEQNEQYYVSLFARKKYFPLLKSDKSQLKRFTSKKEFLISKIKQLECLVGSYQQDGVEIPQEGLALYITVNPRNLRKAGLNLLAKLAQLTRDGIENYNPHQEALSQIQVSCTRKVYFDIDIDEDNLINLNQIISEIKGLINEDCLTFIKTRGGVHCLVETLKIKPEFKKSWYKNIVKFGDIYGDNLVPIPGTYQGGFSPQFLNTQKNGK